MISSRVKVVRERAGPCPIVIILQLGYLPVTYFSSPSLLQSEWAVGQVRSSHVKTPVASSLVEPATSKLRVTIKMAVVAARWLDARLAAAGGLSLFFRPPPPHNPISRYVLRAACAACVHDLTRLASIANGLRRLSRITFPDLSFRTRVLLLSLFPSVFFFFFSFRLYTLSFVSSAKIIMIYFEEYTGFLFPKVQVERI